MKKVTTERQQDVLKDAAIIKEQNHRRQIKEMKDICLNVLLVEDDYYDRQHAKEIIENNYPDVNLTLSAGLVLCKKHNNITELLKEADDCLYEAKSEGRDRVVAAL